MRRLFLWLAMTVFTTAFANATIIAILNSGPTPVSGGFAFNYRADLTGDERLDPVATSGQTCPAPGPTLVQCNPPGTFFTVYDIPGFASANTTASGWFVTTQNVGITPSTINGSSIDNPAIVNVTFTYTGPVVHANGSTVSFTGFQIVSTFNGVNAGGNFSSQATKDAGDSIGNTDQVVGPVSIPAATVPEPGSMALIGAGLIGLALLGARSSRRNTKS